jgi:hypothetical protein
MQSKPHIDKLIDIFLTDLIDRYIEDNAGWKCNSIMSLLIDYEGDIPKFTGGDQSNLSTIIAVMDLRDEHPEFKKINAVVYQLLGEEKHKHKMRALLAKHFYKGLCESTGHAYTDEDRLLAIGVLIPNTGPERAKAAQRFRDRVSAAYQVVDSELIKYEFYAAA